jgi:hypothetical protein
VDSDLAAAVSRPLNRRRRKHSLEHSLLNCGAQQLSRGDKADGITRFVCLTLVSALGATFDAACKGQGAKTEGQTDQLL